MRFVLRSGFVALGLLGLGVSSALADVAIPPSVLYHFGDREPLIRFAQLDGVPADVWTSWMNHSGNYSLKPFRRGLYGSSHPGYCDYYGDLAIGKGRVVWFMAIHVRESCRKREGIADVNQLPEDPQFAAWLASAHSAPFASVQDFTRECYHEEFGRRYANVRDVGGGNRPDNVCEAAINRFFNEAGVKIVVDMGWEQSWYLRDPWCIESIDGTAEELLQLMAFLPGYWKLVPTDAGRRSSYYVPRLGAGTFIVFLQALQDSSALSPELLAALRAAMVASDFRQPSFGGDVQQPLWISQSVGPILDAYVRCRQQGQWKSYEQAIRSFLLLTRSQAAADSAGFDRALDVLLQQAAGLCR